MQQAFWHSDLLHYGIKQRSGRYPWGSGDTPYMRAQLFYEITAALKAQGIEEKEYFKALGLEKEELTTSHIRSTRTIAKEEKVKYETEKIENLARKGVSIEEISKQMGMPPPTVRLRLKNANNRQESALTGTANVIKKAVKEHEIVDIGKGTELNIDAAGRMGISPEKLKAAVALLRDEGYETYNLQIRNPGTTHSTNQKVIVPPGTTFTQANKLADKIHTMGEWTENSGVSYSRIHPPMSFSSKRLLVKFDEDGGTKQDGMIYVRPGVKDLDMSKNNYAQVRILVDGTHFIKGVALKSNDIPDGVDMIFHTSKPRSVGKTGALKPIKDDPENPFGTSIKKQVFDVDPKTGEQRLKSALNLVYEEGDWDTWRTSLPSQFLAKQPHSLIKSQLDITRAQTRDRLNEINQITNAVIRKKALADYADQIDSDAVDLRAASMPRQRTQVLLPVPKMPEDQIYAPRFETGDRVIIIRYPHGGRFEIPEVTVNNNVPAAKKLLGNATDAIGVHPKVAARLSGADFDGDTVTVIPNGSGKVKGFNSMTASQKRVYEQGLNGFDPKIQYGGFVQTGVDKKGRPVGNFPLMRNTGMEMGMITNLITDMQIQAAQPDHVVRAVRHSMVVIDAEKHSLDYTRSTRENNIGQLKELYQGKADSGAKTLLSRATAKERIPEQKLRPMKLGGPVDPDTGAAIYVPTGKTRNKYDSKTKTYLDGKDGRPLVVEPKTQKEKRLALTDDAYTLVRDKADPIERLYADHANEMKTIANEARLAAYNTKPPLRSPKAAAEFKPEVDDLVAQLKAATRQKPLDRKATNMARIWVKAKRDEDQTLRDDPDRLRKVERQAKEAARARLGLQKPVITISDKQWDAIQSGAVSSKRLTDILEYADKKRVAELSMPRTNTVLTTAVSSRAAAMLRAGATTGEVAAALGVSANTLSSAIQRGDLGG